MLNVIIKHYLCPNTLLLCSILILLLVWSFDLFMLIYVPTVHGFSPDVHVTLFLIIFLIGLASSFLLKSFAIYASDSKIYVICNFYMSIFPRNNIREFQLISVDEYLVVVANKNDEHVPLIIFQEENEDLALKTVDALNAYLLHGTFKEACKKLALGIIKLHKRPIIFLEHNLLLVVFLATLYGPLLLPIRIEKVIYDFLSLAFFLVMGILMFILILIPLTQLTFNYESTFVVFLLSFFTSSILSIPLQQVFLLILELVIPEKSIIRFIINFTITMIVIGTLLTYGIHWCISNKTEEIINKITSKKLRKLSYVLRKRKKVFKEDVVRIFMGSVFGVNNILLGVIIIVLSAILLFLILREIEFSLAQFEDLLLLILFIVVVILGIYSLITGVNDYVSSRIFINKWKKLFNGIEINKYRMVLPEPKLMKYCILFDVNLSKNITLTKLACKKKETMSKMFGFVNSEDLHISLEDGGYTLLLPGWVFMEEKRNHGILLSLIPCLTVKLPRDEISGELKKNEVRITYRIRARDAFISIEVKYTSYRKDIVGIRVWLIPENSEAILLGTVYAQDTIKEFIFPMAPVIRKPILIALYLNYYYNLRVLERINLIRNLVRSFGIKDDNVFIGGDRIKIGFEPITSKIETNLKEMIETPPIDVKLVTK